VLYTAISVTNLLQSGGILFITSDGRTVDNTRWSEILVENSDFLSYTTFMIPSEYCHNFWYGKLEWCGYPKMKKIWGYDYSFRENARTWRTVRRMDGQRATTLIHCVARQKTNTLVLRGNVVWLGVYVNGYRIIDQRLLHGDTRVIVEGDVRVADHPFRLTRKPR